MRLGGTPSIRAVHTLVNPAPKAKTEEIGEQMSIPRVVISPH